MVPGKPKEWEGKCVGDVTHIGVEYIVLYKLFASPPRVKKCKQMCYNIWGGDYVGKDLGCIMHLPYRR